MTMADDLTLVLLAAGLGKRFGGDKQFAQVTAEGATLLDYTLFDAARAGVRRVVFVVRPGQESIIRKSITARWGDRFEIRCALQHLEALPAGHACPPDRNKPWGTGHAVLAAEPEVLTPFLVANADDFYGAAAIQTLAQFLREPACEGPSTYALVSYRLGDTLSDAGQVNRARCVLNGDGWLDRVEELTGIAREGSAARRVDAQGRVEHLSANLPVSMNLWGFTPAVFGQLESEFRRFLESAGTSPTAEFFLPDGIQRLIDAGRVRVRVLQGSGRWCGLTYAEDAELVRAFIASCVERGVYPPRLWS